MARRLLRVLTRPLTRLLARFRERTEGFDALPCPYRDGYGSHCDCDSCS